MTRPAALGAGGEAPRRSAALGLLLGLRRRAVLVAVLLEELSGAPDAPVDFHRNRATDFAKMERAASVAPNNGLCLLVLTPARRLSVLTIVEDADGAQSRVVNLVTCCFPEC